MSDSKIVTELPDTFREDADIPDLEGVPAIDDFSSAYETADVKIPEVDVPEDDVPGAYSPAAFEKLLTRRRQSEGRYGLFNSEATMCRMSDLRNSEELLSDIKRKNQEEGLGNCRIPNTTITLINYSVCPKCGKMFSFKDLREYYGSPKPDSAFKNQDDQYRQDTRVCCDDCGAYFLPGLIIYDGKPRNQVQFLCRMQTMHSIESFYMKQGKSVLSKNRKNILQDNKRKAIRNDILLQDLADKPALIANLLQYTPAPLAINLMDGSNIEKGDVLYDTWSWR